MWVYVSIMFYLPEFKATSHQQSPHNTSSHRNSFLRVTKMMNYHFTNSFSLRCYLGYIIHVDNSQSKFITMYMKLAWLHWQLVIFDRCARCVRARASVRGRTTERWSTGRADSRPSYICWRAPQRSTHHRMAKCKTRVLSPLLSVLGQKNIQYTINTKKANDFIFM